MVSLRQKSKSEEITFVSLGIGEWGRTEFLGRDRRICFGLGRELEALPQPFRVRLVGQGDGVLLALEVVQTCEDGAGRADGPGLRGRRCGTGRCLTEGSGRGAKRWHRRCFGSVAARSKDGEWCPLRWSPDQGRCPREALTADHGGYRELGARSRAIVVEEENRREACFRQRKFRCGCTRS